jgi:hypothetical protein
MRKDNFLCHNFLRLIFCANFRPNFLHPIFAHEMLTKRKKEKKERTRQKRLILNLAHGTMLDQRTRPKAKLGRNPFSFIQFIAHKLLHFIFNSLCVNVRGLSVLCKVAITKRGIFSNISFCYLSKKEIKVY